MLENLPEAIGHWLHGTRAGLDQTAIHRLGAGAAQAPIVLGSLAFADHAPMPARYTADGDGLSPPLHWTGVPPESASLVLIVEDADAPTPHPLVHAIVVDLPLGDGQLPEGALDSADHAGIGLETGRNSYLQRRWLPPDPPPGHGVHRYVFQLFALDAGVVFDEAPGRDALLAAIGEHVLAGGSMIGTYERPDGAVRVGETAAPGPVAAA